MDQYCKEDCVYGNEGHCGRSKFQYDSHCDKRFYENKSQRKTPTLKEITDGLCGAYSKDESIED
jgi:hypothetical protein